MESGAQAVDVAPLSRYKQAEFLCCGEYEVVSVDTKTVTRPLYHEPTEAEKKRGIKQNQWGENYVDTYVSTIKIRQVGKVEFAKREDSTDLYTDCADHFDDRMVTENGREDGGPGSGNFGHKGVPGQVGGSAPSDGLPSGKTGKGSPNVMPPLKVPKRPKIEDYSSEEEYEEAKSKYRFNRRQYRTALANRAEQLANRPRKYDSLDKASAWGKEHEVDFSGVVDSRTDPRIYDDIIDVYEEMFDKYPEVKEYVESFGHKWTVRTTDEDPDKVGDFLFSAGGGLTIGNGWNDYENEALFCIDGMHPGSEDPPYLTYGDGTVKTVLRHEFGHEVDGYLRKVACPLPDWDRSVHKTLEEYKAYEKEAFEKRHRYNEELVKLTLEHAKSDYCKTNEMEAFAEGFAEYTSNPDSDYGKAFGEFLRRWWPK